MRVQFAPRLASQLAYNRLCSASISKCRRGAVAGDSPLNNSTPPAVQLESALEDQSVPGCPHGQPIHQNFFAIVKSANVPVLFSDVRGVVKCANASARNCLGIAHDAKLIDHSISDLPSISGVFDENGAWIPFQIFDAQSTPLGRVWFHRTPAQDECSRAQYESAEFLRGVIESNPTPIFVKDSCGKYVFINRAVADVFGKPADEILGKTDAELAFRSNEAPEVQALDARVIATGVEVHSHAELLSDSTGKKRYWETWKRPLPDKNGVINHLLGVAVDRTRQVEIEHELRMNQEELENRVRVRTAELQATHNRLASEIVDRLEAEKEARRRQDELAHAMRLTMMGELAAEIAHEVSQPLTAIFNYTQGCLRCIQSGQMYPDEMETALNAVLTQASLATKVLRGMRDFLHKSEPRQGPVELQTILLQSINLLELEATRLGINISLDIPPSLPRVNVDMVQIQQVVMNLLRNSFEALAAHPRSAPGVSIVVRPLHDTFAEVSIEDNGPGVAPSIASRVFEPFVTTKPSGSGLGLSICRGIVVAHGGSIALVPQAGGTRIVFSLPLVKS